MSYIHTDGVEYSDDKKTLVECPKEATEITILEGVESIGNWAFYGCTGLTSIVIPDSVTSIGEYAFRGCTGLTSIVIPDSETSIGYAAFADCTGLTSIVIPDSVTSIGDSAFENCTGLTSIVIPDSVTSIRDNAFRGCTGLTSIVIPDSETSIGYAAFADCTGLASIVIPDSVTSIGEYAFAGCTGLTSIKVDANNPKYDSRNNCNMIIETETNTLIAGFENTIIPDSVTSIGDGAFYGCTGLTSIVIPDSVTSIGDNAFENCTGLTSIVIPDSVTIIGVYAFLGCSSLTSIVIPDSVTSIKACAFSDCTGIEEMRIPKGTREKFLAMDGLSDKGKFLVEYEEENKEDVAIENEELTILINLAKAYELGIGVAKNYTQAVLFYTQAAEKGSAEAAYKLAEWYAAGEHLPKDYEKAMQFYQQAAKSSFSDAKQKVEQLQKKIDEENERLQDFMQEEWEEREKQQLYNNKETILFFDTETNGLPGNYNYHPSSTSNWPRVLQLGWIVTDVDGNVRKEKSVYIYPDGFEVTAEVTRLTGITTSHIRQYGEDLAEVLDEFMSDVMSVTKVIGHNVNYDKKVLASELYRLNKDYHSLLNKPSVCTMERTTNWCAIPNPKSYSGTYKYPRLQELYAKLFGEDFADAHDALADIRATKECYFELIKRGIIK